MFTQTNREKQTHTRLNPTPTRSLREQLVWCSSNPERLDEHLFCSMIMSFQSRGKTLLMTRSLNVMSISMRKSMRSVMVWKCEMY